MDDYAIVTVVMQEAGPVLDFSASNSGRAILVFLPGSHEIGRLLKQLTQSPQLQAAAQGRTLRILPLHGSLPPADQVATQFTVQLQC